MSVYGEVSFIFELNAPTSLNLASVDTYANLVSTLLESHPGRKTETSTPYAITSSCSASVRATSSQAPIHSPNLRDAVETSTARVLHINPKTGTP